MQATKHEFGGLPVGHITQDQLCKELAKAESSLRIVNEAIDCDNDVDHRTTEPCTISPEDEISTLRRLMNETDKISLVKGLLDIMQSQRPSPTLEVSPIQSILELEIRLRSVLESYHSGVNTTKTPPCLLYEEICQWRDANRRYIKAYAILNIRKTLKRVTYPSPTASQHILSCLDRDPSDISEFKTCIDAIRETEEQHDKILTTEFLMPIIRRVKHHFLASETIPQEKILKMPHLLIAYIRKLVPDVAPILSRIECESFFYQQINELIQHVLFQRGYFEKLSSASDATLTNVVQDIMKYDAFIQEIAGEHCISSLTEKMICNNLRLFRWWINNQYHHAKHVITKSSKTGIDDIISTAETFQSLIHSQKEKISLLKQDTNKSTCLEHLLIPTCKVYLDAEQRRATVLQNAMETCTLHDLSSNISQWLTLIQYTARSAERLSLLRFPGVHDFSDLTAMSESIKKFSNEMTKQCTRRYINLLVERTALSSFLMRAGHLLSHATAHSDHGIDDVYMILSIWDDKCRNGLGRSIVENEILPKVCLYLEQQLLEIIFDDSLDMKVDGCQFFSKVASGIVAATHGIDGTGSGENYARLKDVCRFIAEIDRMRELICSLLEKEADEILGFDELEEDWTLFETTENMIRSQGFPVISVQDAFSLLNRVKK